MSTAEFSLASYEKNVHRVLETHEAILYGDSLKSDRQFVLWRHDVDFSVGAARTIAKVDRTLGLQSTFFFNLHADTYNLRSDFGKSVVAEILNLGHEVAIHLDTDFYRNLPDHLILEDLVQTEKEMFQRMFGVSPSAFSFHNPSETDLEHDEETYANLINCYSKRFRESIGYVSDSNGYWRYSSIEETIATNVARPLQVLTHPEWWSPIDLQPRERLARVLLLDQFDQMNRYDALLASFGRENRSGLSGLLPGDEGNPVGWKNRKTLEEVFGAHRELL